MDVGRAVNDARMKAFDELCGATGLTPDQLETKDGPEIAGLIQKYLGKPTPSDPGIMVPMVKDYAKAKRLQEIEASL